MLISAIMSGSSPEIIQSIMNNIAVMVARRLSPHVDVARVLDRAIRVLYRHHRSIYGSESFSIDDPKEMVSTLAFLRVAMQDADILMAIGLPLSQLSLVSRDCLSALQRHVARLGAHYDLANEAYPWQGNEFDVESDTPPAPNRDGAIPPEIILSPSSTAEALASNEHEATQANASSSSEEKETPRRSKSGGK